MPEERPTTFPALFSNEELDTVRVTQLKTEYPRAAGAQYHPFPIVEKLYPRIAEMIRGLWGTPELDNYLNKLLIDERGNRAGFPAEVVKALLGLSEQHRDHFKFPSPNDVWIASDPSITKSRL